MIARIPLNRSIIHLINKHQLLSFFALTYVLMFGITFSYIYWIPLPYPLVWFVGIFSPTISAVLISGLIGGMPEIKRLLAGFTRWKVSLWWYLAAAFLVLGPLFIALLYAALGNHGPGLAPGLTVPVLLGNLVFTLFSGPLAEEAGWRGFALPRMQAKYSAFSSSLLLGVIWTCWHIPLYFQPGSSQSGIPFPIYLVMVVTLAILFTWIYNNTRGSLLLTVLAHFSFNLTGAFIIGQLGLLPPMVFYMTGGPMLGIGVILVVVIFGPKYLSKKPLEALPFQPKTDPKPLVPAVTG
jgi:uncharacterized protein